MTVELKLVCIDNWYECTRLTVKPEQLNVFPAPVVNWIAESKYVDERNSSCTRIMIGHRPDNLIAGRMYEALGFLKASEEVIDGEIVRLLQTS